MIIPSYILTNFSLSFAVNVHANVDLVITFKRHFLADLQLRDIGQPEETVSSNK